jgi:hypothetical protein
MLCNRMNSFIYKPNANRLREIKCQFVEIQHISAITGLCDEEMLKRLTHASKQHPAELPQQSKAHFACN